MQTRIREVRKAMKLTLLQVADRCDPPTTAQTIGRLETGRRTVSVAWLNRIATALAVDPSDLVTKTNRPDIQVMATLTAHGIEASRRSMYLTPPQPHGTMIGLLVEDSAGDYRSGDQLWLERLEGADIAQAQNRDCLLPLPNGQLCFGRLISMDDVRGLTLLPLGIGATLHCDLKPAWVAAAKTLVRTLGG
jgi:transcriptional regulator with XRE-family HTH domain